MNVNDVLCYLWVNHPGRPVIKIPEENPREVVCELERSGRIPGHSQAVAFIDKSEPHVHTQTTEVYKVLEGELTLFTFDRSTLLFQTVTLRKGDEFIIPPKKVHWAEGNATRVLVTASPPWTKEDHQIVPYPSAPKPPYTHEPSETDPKCPDCGNKMSPRGAIYQCGNCGCSRP